MYDAERAGMRALSVVLSRQGASGASGQLDHHHADQQQRQTNPAAWTQTLTKQNPARRQRSEHAEAAPQRIGDRQIDPFNRGPTR